METTSINSASVNYHTSFNLVPAAHHHYHQHHPPPPQYHVVNSISSTTSSLTSSSSASGMAVNECDDSSFRLAAPSRAAESETVNSSNLIVNYLPQTMTEAEMRQLFEQVDFLERCKLIKNNLNQSLCYGFIKYANSESAERAIKRFNGLKIENKTIKVSVARPSCESIKGANLYVGGIPTIWSTLELENYFSQCGRIIASRILLTYKGQPKGVGFVRFDRRHEAQLAIERLNGRVPDGLSEPLVVRYAKFRVNVDSAAEMTFLTNERAAAATTNGLHVGLQDQPVSPTISSYPMSFGDSTTYELMKPLHHSIANVFSSESVQNPAMPPIVTTAAPPPQPLLPLIANTVDLAQMKTAPTSGQTTFYQSGIANNLGWRICVRNLPPDSQETLLWELFGPFGAVLNVRLMRTYTTTNYAAPKGLGHVGFVTMSVIDDANKAVFALDGYTIANRTLQVFLANTQDYF